MYRDEIGDGEIPACSVNLESELPASWSWRLGPHQPLSRDREFTGTPDAKVQVRQAFAMYAGEAGAAAMIEGANGVEPILGLRGLCEALRSRVDVYARLAHLKSESALRPNPLSCIKLDATMSKETVRTDNKDSKVDGFEYNFQCRALRCEVDAFGLLVQHAWPDMPLVGSSFRTSEDFSAYCVTFSGGPAEPKLQMNNFNWEEFSCAFQSVAVLPAKNEIGTAHTTYTDWVTAAPCPLSQYYVVSITGAMRY
eukprot:6213071-Pleurochrysis_carterae.AAC.4